MKKLTVSDLKVSTPENPIIYYNTLIVGEFQKNQNGKIYFKSPQGDIKEVNPLQHELNSFYLKQE